MKMMVSFYYEKSGCIEVEARSASEAKRKAQDILNKMSWEDCEKLAVCVYDSAQIDENGTILNEDGNIVDDD